MECGRTNDAELLAASNQSSITIKPILHSFFTRCSTENCAYDGRGPRRRHLALENAVIPLLLRKMLAHVFGALGVDLYRREKLRLGSAGISMDEALFPESEQTCPLLISQIIHLAIIDTKYSSLSPRPPPARHFRWPRPPPHEQPRLHRGCGTEPRGDARDGPLVRGLQ